MQMTLRKKNQPTSEGIMLCLHIISCVQSLIIINSILVISMCSEALFIETDNRQCHTILMIRVTQYHFPYN